MFEGNHYLTTLPASLHAAFFTLLYVTLGSVVACTLVVPRVLKMCSELLLNISENEVANIVQMYVKLYK